MKLNVAAGARPLKGYINSDVTPQSPDIAHVDVLGLVEAYGEGVADEVRADWLVDHLTVPELVAFLQQAWRVLKPGGVLNIVDADMIAWVKWTFKRQDWDMMHDILFSLQTRGEHDYHKQAIYPGKMERMLKAAGFAEVDMRTDVNKAKCMLDLYVTARKGEQ